MSPPQLILNNLLYKRWVKQRAADVDKWSDGRLGYVMKFGYFFFYFIPNLLSFFPIESYVACFVLYSVSFYK